MEKLLNNAKAAGHQTLPFLAEGLGVLAVLGLCFGVVAFASGEPAGLIFFEGGGPEADCCSLLNSNFLLAGGYKKANTVHKP